MKRYMYQQNWLFERDSLPHPSAGLQPDTSTTPLPMRYASMGYTSMGFTSTGYTSTGHLKF